MTPPKPKKTAKKTTKKATKKPAKKASSGRSKSAAETQGPGELAEAGTVATALISGNSFTDIPVQFTVRDGTAYFEGDIVLGSVDQLEDGTSAVRAVARDVTQGLHQGVKPGSPVADVDVAQPGPSGAVIIPGLNFRWSGGRVPFEVDPSLTTQAQTQLTAAINHWHDRTRLSFRPRQPTDPHWLRCRDANECSSWVGRQGGRQDVNLSALCGFGASVHELGHAVGLWHEQSREDRDQFVQILWQNIQPAQQHNFNQHITDGDDVGGYDYGSIMHYGATAFGTIDPATGRARTTIQPTQTLPPGTVIGQRAGLSVGDRAAVAKMYESIYPNTWNTWLGNFEGGTKTQILYYSPARQVWYLGRTSGSTLSFSPVGDTSGFGDLNDGRPFWVGDFTGGGSADILFYFPGDDNWWLGTMQGGQLSWSHVGNTSGFGHAINDGRPFWVGDFTGGGSTDILFYFPGDDNWWLGTIQGGQLTWSFVGNTSGFGHAINDGRPFWTGDFTGGGTTDILFYFPGDDNWWLGTIQGGQLSWSHVGNTSGFGHAINDGRPFWTGDFTGGGSTDILFYFPGDDNWWLGTMQGGQLTWSFVGNTSGFGHAINDGRPFWVGDFTGGGSTDILFYFPGDDNWWLGTIQEVPSEPAECADLRALISRRRKRIAKLRVERRTLNRRIPAELIEIQRINRRITSHRQAIVAAEASMAQLACPITPNPGGRQLAWSSAGNTIGFGHNIYDGRPFWIGDFTGDGQADVVFHFRGDLNWWQGRFVADTLSWTLATTW